MYTTSHDESDLRNPGILSQHCGVTQPAEDDDVGISWELVSSNTFNDAANCVWPQTNQICATKWRGLKLKYYYHNKQKFVQTQPNCCLECKRINIKNINNNIFLKSLFDFFSILKIILFVSFNINLNQARLIYKKNANVNKINLNNFKILYFFRY